MNLDNHSNPSASAQDQSVNPAWYDRPISEVELNCTGFGSLPGWLHAGNPLFLISAVFLLGGCFLISGALAESPGRTMELLALLGVFNAYEIILIGLAWLVFYRIGTPRDGRSMWMIAIFLMLDLTFLHFELMTSDMRTGLAVMAVATGLTIGKMGMIVWMLGLRWGWRETSYFVAGVAMIFVGPGLLRLLGGAGDLQMVVMLSAWAIVVTWAAMIPRSSASPVVTIRRDLNVGWLVSLALILPLISIVAHLVVVHWQHETMLPLSVFSLILFGLMAWHVRGLTHDRQKRAWLYEWTIPVLAVFCSLTTTRKVGIELLDGLVLGRPLESESIWTVGWIDLTTLRLALVILAGFYLVMAWQKRSVRLCVMSGLAMGAAGLGATLQTMMDRFWIGLEWLEILIPRTQLAWGMTAVIVAFILLGSGVLWSMYRAERMSGVEH